MIDGRAAAAHTAPRAARKYLALYLRGSYIIHHYIIIYWICLPRGIRRLIDRLYRSVSVPRLHWSVRVDVTPMCTQVQ